MRIAQVTDCHLFSNQQKTGYSEINPFDSLGEVLSAVVAYAPDLLLVTGDISGDGTKQSYQHFLQLVENAGLTSRLRTLPGNHDPRSEYALALSAFDISGTSIPLDDWNLIGLDTRYKGTLGRISAAQLLELEDNIEAAPAQHWIVACHHHPVDCGGWMDKHVWVNKEALTSLLIRQKSVKQVVYGHIHMSKQDQIGNCDLAACPSSCWQWANTSAFSLDSKPAGFRIMDLKHDGSVTSKVYRIS